MKVTNFITNLKSLPACMPVCVPYTHKIQHNPPTEFRNIRVDAAGNDIVITALDTNMCFEGFPPPFTNVACLLGVCKVMQNKIGVVEVRVEVNDGYLSGKVTGISVFGGLFCGIVWQ